MRMTLAQVAKIKEQVEAGVDYSARYGALCPWCGKRTKIVSTQPWDDNVRTRYHRCDNPRCPVCSLGLSLKSIQIEEEKTS